MLTFLVGVAVVVVVGLLAVLLVAGIGLVVSVASTPCLWLIEAIRLEGRAARRARHHRLRHSPDFRALLRALWRHA